MTSTVPQSTTQPAIAALEAYVSAMNDNDVPRALTFLSDDLHYEDAIMDLRFTKSEFSESYTTWLGSMSRWHWRLEHIAVGGYRAAATWVFTGLYRALPPPDQDLFTGEPTATEGGFPFVTNGISTFRFDTNWRVIEETDYWTGKWVATP
jgi:SnoaL-like protein